jgi:hypothetical protein
MKERNKKMGWQNDTEKLKRRAGGGNQIENWHLHYGSAKKQRKKNETVT